MKKKRMGLRKRILDYMQRSAYRPMTDRELGSALDIGKREWARFSKQLRSLEASGRIVRTRTGGYAMPERLNLVTGKISATAGGNAFVDAEQEQIGVFISADNVGSAVDGDRVVARVHKQARQGRRAEGVVVRVLERRTAPVVGAYHATEWSGFVVPDRPLLQPNVVIPPSDSNGAKSGDKVVVEITKYPDGPIGPQGKIVEVLGQAGESGVDVTAVVRRLNLPEEFPDAVLEKAESLDVGVDRELADREDLRGMTLVTIDGADAKDYDDAVSLQVSGDQFVLGVHIADVSHYVTARSLLDREALERGTSVYLVDRTIHMFPPVIAQNLASLRENEDRLAVSVFITFHGAEVQDVRFCRSVIRVQQRLIYDHVSAALEGNEEAVPGDVLPLLQQMSELASMLRTERMRRGAIDMDMPEPKIVLDAEGKPVDLMPHPRGIADQLIEEFMIAANEAVAGFMLKNRIPCVYRVHEPPDEEAVANLGNILGFLGLRLKGNVSRPQTYQRLLNQVKGRAEERLLSQLVLRSMSKARYAMTNVKHFGLASPAYTHFTSPIRRYPDLMVHRILKRVLAGRVNDEFRERQAEILPQICDQCSELERRAEEAEREVNRIKILEFMSGKIGEEFSGIISGVTAYGFYVQLENTAEGLVHVSTLTDDFYRFQEDQAALVGRRGRKYRLGDRVRVWVMELNRERQELGLRLCD